MMSNQKVNPEVRNWLSVGDQGQTNFRDHQPKP